MELHEIIENELLEQKSLSALIWLINNGREFEFKHKDTSCFITRDLSLKFVSLWVDKKEQSFDSMEELLRSANINGIPFIKAWEDIQISFLF